MRIAVIGAGVVGASIAWRLSQLAVDVLLIDAAQPGEATSGASFAWANASSAEDPAYFTLREHGLRELTALADDIDAHWLLATGHLRWAATEEGSAKLAARVHTLATQSYPAQLVTGRQANNTLEPAVRFPHPDHPIAYFPTELAIDAPRLAKQLVGLAATNGATVVLGRPVEAIELNESRAGEVTVGTTRHVVDGVVNAAGPHGDLVARMIGRELELIEEPGLVGRLRCPTVPVRHAMHAPHVEIRPDGAQQVLIHSRVVDNKLGPTGYAQPTHVEELTALAREVVPELGNAELVDTRVGWRPIPWDGLPSVGPVSAVPGYYEAITHSGVTLCAVIGRLAADEIVAGIEHPLLATFRPDRPHRPIEASTSAHAPR